MGTSFEEYLSTGRAALAIRVPPRRVVKALDRQAVPSVRWEGRRLVHKQYLGELARVCGGETPAAPAGTAPVSA